MKRCFQLALLGKKHVKPNPMVGAVLVHHDVVIGEGYHRQFGGPHAEVNCIQNVLPANAHLIRESTMYVSLEPCIHYGKTPPCADLLIQSGIKKVVIACSDPFAQVNGGGIKKLEAAGITVHTPFMEEEARELNRRFFTFHLKKRPYVILKWARSNDNKIASIGSRYLISNNTTNTLVHKWRGEEGAILIGTNTILTDNPSLTTRHWPGADPLRLVIDRQLKMPRSYRLMSDAQPLVIFNGIKNGIEGEKLFVKTNSNDMIDEILSFLYTKNITSLIVEGGALLLQSFIDQGSWDEARIIINRALEIGPGVPAPILTTGKHQIDFHIFSDEISIIKNNNSLP